MEYTVQDPRGTMLGKKVIPSRRSADIALECNELFRLEGNQRGRVIQVMEGRVWLTQAGNEADMLLEQGQTHQVSGKALVLLQGLPTARVRFTFPT